MLNEITPNLFKYVYTYENERHESVFAPVGWDEESIAGYKRNLKYFGLTRSYSLPLSFGLDGKDLLRAAFAKYGVEATVNLEVYERNEQWEYDILFKGDFDFKTYKYDGTTVNIELLQSGITQEILSSENIEYEFKLEGSDVVDMELPGIKFTDYAKFITKYVDGSNLNQAKRFTIGIDMTTPFEADFLIGRNTEQRNAADSDNFGGDVFLLGNRTGGVPTRIKGFSKGKITPSTDLAPTRLCELIICSTLRSVLDPVYQIFVGDSLPNDFVNFNVEFDFTYTIAQNEGLFLYSRSDQSVSVAALLVEESEIEASYASVADPSNCKCLKMFDLYKRIINRISPTSIPNSDYINSNWANLLFTSGNGIRELENPTIKISFSDFFATAKALDDVGFGITGQQARIEKGSFFARPVQSMDIGNVNTCVVTIAEEFMFKKISVGYEDISTNDNDGLEEYNSGQQWSLPFSTIVTEESYVSKTKAAQFLIEQIRTDYNIKKKPTNDTSTDNDTFMVDCNPVDIDGKYRPILGGSYASVTGLTYPLTAYNLRITPKKNLLRHAPYLRSILDKQDDRFIQFASGDKNTKLTTVIGGVTVKENQSIPVSSLNGKYFKPYFATITAKLPRYALDIMDSSPYGFIKFNFNDEIFRGFIFDFKVDLAKNKEQELKLLLMDLPPVTPPPPDPIPIPVGNDFMSVQFQKNDCVSGRGEFVPITVDADTYFGVDKASANGQATDYINANGQANANSVGTCIVTPGVSNDYYCFSGITTMNGASMVNIQNNLPVASSYARCLRAIGNDTAQVVAVDPNVYMRITLTAGVTSDLQIGQVDSSNFYPFDTLFRAADPGGPYSVLVTVGTDGKIVLNTDIIPAGTYDIPLPYSVNPYGGAAWYTLNPFICQDCQISYDAMGNIISNTCGNVMV